MPVTVSLFERVFDFSKCYTKSMIWAFTFLPQLSIGSRQTGISSYYPCHHVSTHLSTRTKSNPKVRIFQHEVFKVIRLASGLRSMK